MNKQFVTYEIALAVKELGFDEECLAYYSKEAIYRDKDYNKTNFVLLSAKKRGELVGHGSIRNYLFQWLLDNNRTYGELHTLSQSVTAPLWQQVIDWFREKYNYFIYIIHREGKYGWKIDSNICYEDFSAIIYSTYEEAREAAILKAIEIIKNGK